MTHLTKHSTKYAMTNQKAHVASLLFTLPASSEDVSSEIENHACIPICVGFLRGV